MMTEKQQSKVAELKATIAATVATASGTPKEVRSATVALTKELRRSGTTARALAVELGVHETTLSRWKRDERASRRPVVSPTGKLVGDAGFRRVEVTAPAA